MQTTYTHPSAVTALNFVKRKYLAEELSPHEVVFEATTIRFGESHLCTKVSWEERFSTIVIEVMPMKAFPERARLGELATMLNEIGPSRFGGRFKARVGQHTQTPLYMSYQVSLPWGIGFPRKRLKKCIKEALEMGGWVAFVCEFAPLSLDQLFFLLETPANTD